MESTNEKDFEKFTVTQLKEELRLRYLPVSGNKSELITKIVEDNVSKNENGTMEIFKDEKFRRMSEQIELEHIKSLMQEKQDINPIPENDNNMITKLLISQTELMKKMSNINPTFQVFSTSDTSQAIPLFWGNKTDNVSEWINQVERIASLANWSHNLTLVNASMRLRGSASDWHKVIGKKCDDWLTWKSKICDRFSIKMSFAEFIMYQKKRTLRNNETITEYIYSKNATLEKSPTAICELDRVSLILEGITELNWSVCLASHCCKDVEELLNHAASLDNIRKIVPKDFYNQKKPENVSKFDNNTPPSNMPTQSNSIPTQSNKPNQSKFIPKFNKELEKESEQTCYRCKNKGHISYNCPNARKQMIQDNISVPSNNNMNKVTQQVNCIQDEEPRVTLIPIMLNGSIKLDALPDSGSVITLIDKKVLPVDTIVYPWQKGSYKVAGSFMTPIGWFSVRITVGKIDYIMPQVAICENLPISMILGKDWQLSVYARIVHEPDGTICIITPTHTEIFPNIKKENMIVNCCIDNTKQENIEIKDEDKNKVLQLVSEYDDIFKNDKNDIGKFKDIELEIKLKHNKPISCKPYRLPEPERKFLKETIEEWLDEGICRMSNSPYAAPMFVVEQPFHSTTPYRPVVDYSRTINPITILDVQPIERMEDVIQCVSQYKYKFKLDIYHAYHNICIKEEDIYKTAVITQDYHIEFERVMFGLVGGPAIMSKVIKSTYGSLYDQGVRCYYDDISGGANTINELIQLLTKTFDVTRNNKLKLNKEKCIFIDIEIPLFGRLVGYKQERVDPSRTKAVEQYKTLSTFAEVRSFLGFAGTFRKYIQNFACIAKPLQNIMKTKKYESDNSKIEQNKNRKITLNEEQNESFQKLKTLITSAPILANFDQNAETIVETDSSYNGLGACLLQIQNNEKKVIEYASRNLKDAEKRYHINELEITAVYWAVVQNFRIYLLGVKFTLVTDSYSTAYIINKAKLNRKFARYVIDLAPFDFIPVHRPGKQNAIADHLSRYTLNDLCLTIVSSNSEKLRMAQVKDPFIQQVSEKLKKEPNHQHLKQINESFKIIDGIMIHVNKEQTQNVETIVVPQSLQTSILKIAHDDNGHLDFDTTLTKIRTKYWWKTMRKDVKAYTKACMICAKVNRRTKLSYGEMGQRPIPSTPMQVISSDHIVALPITEAGNKYIFVHIDHATRYVMARPTCSLSAQDVIHTIENDIIYMYGPPMTYITDSAPCFTSHSTQNFFAKYGIEHIPTTPYTPQSNGLVERANATIISILTKYAMDNETDWDMLLPKVLLCINNSKQKTTGYSPFYLLFGFEPQIPPNEIHFSTVIEDTERLNQLDILYEAREKALKNIEKVHDINKRRFDLKRIHDNFKEGDIVLYEWYKPTNTKLTPRYWGPFKILRKIGSVCFEIEDIKKPTVKKIVHVQYLKPVSDNHGLDFISDISDDDKSKDTS